MGYNYMTAKEAIIEFIIQNQGHFKQEVERLRYIKNEALAREPAVFRSDLEEQYEARIKQFIAFTTGDHLALPIEYVIIELESINLEELFNV